MKTQNVTLCFLREDGRILLAMKKRGFGVGKWNGVGGKIHDNETPLEAAIRETIEEIQVKPLEITKQALICFRFLESQTNPEWEIQCHVFSITKWSGKPRETEEMAPRWFSYDEIPYERMWIDDKFWLPKFLKGEKFTANFSFINEEEIKNHSFSKFLDE